MSEDLNLVRHHAQEVVNAVCIAPTAHPHPLQTPQGQPLFTPSRVLVLICGLKRSFICVIVALERKFLTMTPPSRSRTAVISGEARRREKMTTGAKTVLYFRIFNVKSIQSSCVIQCPGKTPSYGTEKIDRRPMFTRSLIPDPG